MLFLAAALAVAASEHPRWVVGRWSWANRGEAFQGCSGDHETVTYDARGRYDFMDETGRWRVVGNRLIETMTDAGGTGDPAGIGKPRILRFVVKRPGVLKILPEGGIMTKCPAR